MTHSKSDAKWTFTSIIFASSITFLLLLTRRIPRRNVFQFFPPIVCHVPPTQWISQTDRLRSMDPEFAIFHDSPPNFLRTNLAEDNQATLHKQTLELDGNEAWKNRITGVMAEKSYRDYDAINGQPTEFEWNIFPGFTTLQLCGKINDLLSDLGQTPETFTGRILFMSMFNDISCDRKDKKMNVWQMPELWKYLLENLVLDNGHFLDQVLKRNGILQRTVHKEPGIISRTKCCWNLQKADILLSVQRLHCPGVFSRSKDVGNCQYTSLQMETQLIQFIALFFLSISSVSTEQWRPYAKNLRAIKIERGNLRFWWVNQLFSVKLRQKFLCRMKPLWIIKLWKKYIQQVESLSPENRAVRKQDLCVLLKLDKKSWPRTLVAWDNFAQ